MAFWNRKKTWEDEYDQYYAQDRRAEPKKGPGRFRFVPHLFLLAFVGALFLGVAGLVNGPTMVEKLLISLAAPVGLVWLLLMLLVYFSLLLRQSWPALIGFLCWLVLTVFGNAWVANALAASLEASYQDITISELEPYDYVVVLGGGTNTNLNGRAQATSDGDRVLVAAQMYHAGQAKNLICTGSQKFRSSAKDLHPREESAEILLSLNVPGNAVHQMKGENTSQEMDNLKTWVEKNSKTTGSARVGIITSAWHLQRALRLAKSRGLEVEGIPASFLSEPFSPSPGLVIPSGDDLGISARIVKEYLARIVGR